MFSGGILLILLAMAAALHANLTPTEGVFEGRDGLRVMTYNLYVGSGFGPVLSAQTTEEFRLGVTTILNAVRASDSAGRMAAIANGIAEVGPHLISLQEVAIWSTGPAPGSLQVESDYLQLLLDSLAEQGQAYTPVVAVPHFRFTAPSSTGDFVSVVFRIAILARSDLSPGVFRFSGVRSALFTDSHTFAAPAMGTSIPFSRAWASVDASYNGKPFRFIATHLEAFAPSVTIVQASELLAGPAKTSLPVIVAGDLNSDAADHDDPAYPAYQSFFVAQAGFVDAWRAANPAGTGFTCCRNRGLTSPASSLRRRVDLVLIRGSFKVEAAAVQGDDPQHQTASGVWPSDHAAVAVLLLQSN